MGADARRRSHPDLDDSLGGETFGLRQTKQTEPTVSLISVLQSEMGATEMEYMAVTVAIQVPGRVKLRYSGKLRRFSPEE